MEPPSSPRVDFLNLTGRRRRLSRIRHAVQTVLQGQSRRVEVVLVDDDAIRELNRLHRELDEATDVLTFPAPEFPRSPLGEIVISVPYAERQALAREIRVEDELCYLAIHGALHLLGLEDETEAGRRGMQESMAHWGQVLGLPDQPEWSSLLHEPVGGAR